MSLIKIFLLVGGMVLRVLDVLKGYYDRPFVSVIGQIGDYRTDPARRPPYEQIDCVGRVPGCASCFAQRYKDGAHSRTGRRTGRRCRRRTRRSPGPTTPGSCG